VILRVVSGVLGTSPGREALKVAAPGFFLLVSVFCAGVSAGAILRLNLSFFFF